MEIGKNILKFIGYTIIFFLCFSVFDLIRGKEIDITDTILQALVTECVLMLFQFLGKIYSRRN